MNPPSFEAVESAGANAVVSFTDTKQASQFPLTAQHKKMGNLMLGAILSSNKDQYDLAFKIYRRFSDSKEIVLHPVLDAIVLRCFCDDIILMKHFESKKSNIYHFIKALINGSSIDDCDHSYRDLTAIRDAVVKQ